MGYGLIYDVRALVNIPRSHLELVVLHVPWGGRPREEWHIIAGVARSREQKDRDPRGRGVDGEGTGHRGGGVSAIVGDYDTPLVVGVG